MSDIAAKNKARKPGLTGAKRYIIDAVIFIAVCAVIIVADQITKMLVYRIIPYGSSNVLIPRLLEISHVHNTGAAWGIFNQHIELLSAVTLIACAGLCFLYVQSNKKLFKASLLLVIGGALGNLIDRIFRGYVIDFIKVWIFKYEFPNFNVADSCITIGCVLMIVAVLTSGKSEKDLLFRKHSILGKLLEKDRNKEAAKQAAAAEANAAVNAVLEASEAVNAAAEANASNAATDNTPEEAKND